jgi:hypothetical protein
MPKFNEVFEFEGQEYVKSERDSSEVKDGDVVRILKHHPDFDLWTKDYSDRFGKCFKVSGITFDAISMIGITGLWVHKYFEILEPAPKTNPRPHSELIKQWADDDSLEVQFQAHPTWKWKDTAEPQWLTGHQYRFKPKTVPAWQVLYKQNEDFYISNGHYSSKEEFTRIGVNKDKEFIRFVPETEKQFEI